MHSKKKLTYIILTVSFAFTVLVFQNCGNTKFSQANLASTAGQVILTTSERPSENSPGTITTTTSSPSNTGVTSTTYSPSTTVFAPDPLAGKGLFNDVSGLRGQQWVDSNEIIISGLPGPTEMKLSSQDANTAYTLNGVRTSLSVDASNQFYSAKLLVQNGDRLGLHQINIVWGKTTRYVTTYLNGVENNWTITSYNYAAFGGKNCKGYQGPCTGKVIGKMAVGDLSGWGPGGCVDIAQASQEIKCFEKPSSGSGDCAFYDGPADLSAGNRPGLDGVDCSEIK